MSADFAQRLLFGAPSATVLILVERCGYAAEDKLRLRFRRVLITVTAAQAETITKLVDHLEDLDDVQEIYHNVSLSSDFRT